MLSFFLISINSYRYTSLSKWKYDIKLFTVFSLTPEELRSKTDQGDILWEFCLWTSNVKAIGQ